MGTSIRRIFFPQRHPDNYIELPSTDSDLRFPSPRQRHASGWRILNASSLHSSPFLRRIVLFIISLPSLFLFWLLWSGIPPSYYDIREFERALPQHNLSLPYPEGKDGMYLRFPEHIWGHGLNNVLQETVLMSYLAYLTNRSYVFEDYTWSHLPLPYTLYEFTLRPSRIPLNALISGPSAGAPMRAPRAVSAEYWERACPQDRRVRVSSKDAPSNADGQALVEWWVERLRGVPESCVEVSNDPPVFSWFLFGSDRVLSLWPSLSQSPIIRDFAWSHLVTSGVARNLHLLSSSAPLSHSYMNRDLVDARSTPLPGLVAVHLRRGDYEQHCPRLARWGAQYNGFNQFPSLPDRFNPPNFSELSSLDGRENYYIQHCWPEVQDIVAKLHQVRNEHHGELRRVYVLTNGSPSWMASLREKLVRDGWADVKSSLDIQVDRQQKYVAMAIDMAIAERAEVFIGNGFSSLTSNIVMLRMAKEMDSKDIRFW